MEGVDVQCSVEPYTEMLNSSLVTECSSTVDESDKAVTNLICVTG